MKKTVYFSFVLLLFARVAHASFDYSLSQEDVEAMTRVLQTYAHVSAIIVASLTSVIVFNSAHKMRGGVFGKVLNYFGAGMLFVLSGFIINAYPNFIPISDSGVVSNILFITGYVLMAVSATKLSRAIEGK
jgi:hypothetical protein